MTKLTKEQMELKNKAKANEVKADAKASAKAKKVEEAKDKVVKDHIAKHEKQGKTTAVLAALVAQTKATNAQTKAIVALTKTTLTSSDRVTELLDKSIDDAYPDDGEEPDINVNVHNLEGQTARVRKSKTEDGIDIDILIKEPDFSDGSALDRAMKERYDDHHDADDYISNTAEALAKGYPDLSYASTVAGLCVEFANVVAQKAGLKKDIVLKDIVKKAKDLSDGATVYGHRITKEERPLDINGTPSDKVATTYKSTDGVDGDKLDVSCIGITTISDAPKHDYIRFVDKAIANDDLLNLAFAASNAGATLDTIKAIRLKGGTSPNEAKKAFFYLTLLKYGAHLTYDRMQHQDKYPASVTPAELVELGRCLLRLDYNHDYIRTALISASIYPKSQADIGVSICTVNAYLRDSVSKLDAKGQEQLYVQFVSALVDASYKL